NGKLHGQEKRHAVYKLATTYGCEALIRLRYWPPVQCVRGTISSTNFRNLGNKTDPQAQIRITGTGPVPANRIPMTRPDAGPRIAHRAGQGRCEICGKHGGW